MDREGRAIRRRVKRCRWFDDRLVYIIDLMSYFGIRRGAMPRMGDRPMNADSARDDLAFMRALVEPSDSWLKQFGETYSAAGLCYCVQMLLHGGQVFGLAPAHRP